MDNDKTILEKITDVVKSIIDTASTAETQAIALDPKQVAGKTNEQVYVTDAAAAPVFITPKKKRTAKKRVAKGAPAAKAPAKKVASKKTAKKIAPKTSTKKAVKKTKKTKTTAKKALKKKSNR